MKQYEPVTLSYILGTWLQLMSSTDVTKKQKVKSPVGILLHEGHPM